jgi:hypothetical protein
MLHQTRTTGLENQQDSILSEIATALVPITATAWKAAQHFSYGARGFMRVPVSEANDLNYLLGLNLNFRKESFFLNAHDCALNGSFLYCLLLQNIFWK